MTLNPVLYVACGPTHHCSCIRDRGKSEGFSSPRSESVSCSGAPAVDGIRILRDPVRDTHSEGFVDHGAMNRKDAKCFLVVPVRQFAVLTSNEVESLQYWFYITSIST